MDSRLRGNDKKTKQKEWIPNQVENDKGGAWPLVLQWALVIGYSMVIGYLGLGHFFVIQNSSLIRHSDFGIRHLLFFLFPTCLIPTA